MGPVAIAMFLLPPPWSHTSADPACSVDEVASFVGPFMKMRAAVRYRFRRFEYLPILVLAQPLCNQFRTVLLFVVKLSHYVPPFGTDLASIPTSFHLRAAR